MKINSIYLVDGYKVGHYNMYQDGVEKVYSTFTPRSNKYAPKGNNGKIVVRNRGWEELRELQKEGHELAWKDIVDGKQKLNAIKSFMDGEYPDLHGNYFEDLSDQAQIRLTNNQLISYSELPEKTTDEEVLKQFLRLNFSGVPQSQEHLDYIKSLL